MFDKFNHGKTALFIAILIVVIVFFYQNSDENVELIYNEKVVEISAHASCRMDCREISKTDVQAVLKYGKQNDDKSNPNYPNCPRYALEGSTKHKEAVRIIVADCENDATLVTVIDLKNNYDCDCK